MQFHHPKAIPVCVCMCVCWHTCSSFKCTLTTITVCRSEKAALLRGGNTVFKWAWGTQRECVTSTFNLHQEAVLVGPLFILENWGIKCISGPLLQSHVVLLCMKIYRSSTRSHVSTLQPWFDVYTQPQIQGKILNTHTCSLTCAHRGTQWFKTVKDPTVKNAASALLANAIC